jgi:hypothetical protein
MPELRQQGQVQPYGPYVSPLAGPLQLQNIPDLLPIHHIPPAVPSPIKPGRKIFHFHFMVDGDVCHADLNRCESVRDSRDPFGAPNWELGIQLEKPSDEFWGLDF